jgi:hypothetical protein
MKLINDSKEKQRKPEQVWSKNISIHSEVLLDVFIVQYVAVCGK